MSPDYQRYLDALSSITAEQNPQVLQCVYEKLVGGCRCVLTFEFTDWRLILQAVPDDDTIEVSAEKAKTRKMNGMKSAIDQEVWKSLANKALGWGWITVNQQGYCDGIMLSFENLNPLVVLNVVGSSIKIHSMHPSSVPEPKANSSRMIHRKKEGRAVVNGKVAAQKA